MDAPVTGEILRVFEDLPDPRGQNVRHQRIDMLTTALCGVLYGAVDWVAVVHYRDLDSVGKTLAPILVRRREDQMLPQLPERPGGRAEAGLTE